MADWPEIEELRRNAKLRGGQKTREYRKKFAVQITLRTYMACGTKLEMSDRVLQHEVNATRTRFTSGIKAQASNHIKNCNTCKARYK